MRKRGTAEAPPRGREGRRSSLVGRGGHGDAAPSPTQPSAGVGGTHSLRARTPPDTPSLVSQAGGRAGETGDRSRGEAATAAKGGETLTGSPRWGRGAPPMHLKPLGVSAASPLNPKSPATPRNTGRAQRATQALGKPRRIPGPRGYSGGSLRGKGPRRAAQVWVRARHPRLGAAVKWRL